MKFAFLLVVALFSVGCGLSSNQTSSYFSENKSSQIIGGTKVAEGAPITASIVGIYDTENQFTCTGTLLADNVVLTAAHCVEAKANRIRIVFGLELMSTINAREVDIRQNFIRTATSVKVHPKYDDVANELKNTDWHDIALIKFAGTVPEGYKPATFLTDSSLLVKGAMVTLAGYGVTSVEAEQVDVKKIKNIDKAIEDGDIVCDDDANTHCFKVVFIGDDELYETKAPIEALAETEVRLDEGEHGTCVGDSGGPAYIEKDGQYYFFGITSRGSFACDSEGVYTNALTYKDWIDENVKLLK